MQSMPPLVHCPVNDDPFKAEPFVNQTFYRVVDVTELTTVDAFL